MKIAHSDTRSNMATSSVTMAENPRELATGEEAEAAN